MLGIHITVLYSSIDLARVMYAIVLVLRGASNPRVLMISHRRWLDFFWLDRVCGHSTFLRVHVS